MPSRSRSIRKQHGQDVLSPSRKLKRLDRPPSQADEHRSRTRGARQDFRGQQPPSDVANACQRRRSSERRGRRPAPRRGGKWGTTHTHRPGETRTTNYQDARRRNSLYPKTTKRIPPNNNKPPNNGVSSPPRGQRESLNSRLAVTAVTRE